MGRKVEDEVVEIEEYEELILVLVLDLTRNQVGHRLKLHQVERGDQFCENRSNGPIQE